MQPGAFGARGEKIAQNYLKKLGYKIIATNYKNKIGEIDIIALDGKTIVFVEVKARMSRKFGDPREAVDERKQLKIRQVAELFLIKNKKNESYARFDVIAILGDGVDSVEHIKDAF